MVHPNLEIDGTLTIEDGGELFVPFGGTLVSSDLVHPVDTIADLRNVAGKYKYVYVTGYHTKNDGAFGSHIFRLKGVKTTETDNGGTVIIATIGGTDYVYELQYDGAVNVKWFGGYINQALLHSDEVIVSESMTITYDVLLNTNNTLRIPLGVTLTFDDCRIIAYQKNNVTIENNGELVSINLSNTTEAKWIPNYHPTLNSPERAFIEFGGTSTQHSSGFLLTGNGVIRGQHNDGSISNWTSDYAINHKGVGCWWADNITIEGNTLYHFAGECVYVRSDMEEPSPVENVLFKDLIIGDVGFNALNFNARSKIKNAVMVNCRTIGVNKQAVELSSGSVINCSLSGSEGASIMLGGGNVFDVTVDGCTIDAATSTANYAVKAVKLWAQDLPYNFRFTNNTVRNVPYAAIEIKQATTAVVVNNTIDNYNTLLGTAPNVCITFSELVEYAEVSNNLFINKSSVAMMPLGIDENNIDKITARNNTIDSAGKLLHIDVIGAILQTQSLNTNTLMYQPNNGATFEHRFIDGYGVADLSSIPNIKNYGGMKFSTYGNGLGRMTFRFNKSGNGSNVATDNLIIDGRGGIIPGGADSTQSLGTSSSRWSVLFAYFVGLSTSRIIESYFANVNTTNAVIVSSDERQKEFIDITEVERKVAIELKSLIFKYKRLEAINKEAAGGEKARLHFGTNAQAVKAVFEKHGLNAFDYSLLCYNEWQETSEIKDDEGNIIQEYVPAGNSYGIRYEELLCFIISAM